MQETPNPPKCAYCGSTDEVEYDQNYQRLTCGGCSVAIYSPTEDEGSDCD